MPTNKKQWVKVVHREQGVLFIDLICSGITKKYIKKNLKINAGIENYAYINGDVYYYKPDYGQAIREIERIYKKRGASSALELINKLEKLRRTLEKEVNKIKKIKNIKKLSQQELTNILEDYVEKFYDYSTSLFIPLFFEKIIENDLQEILAKKVKNPKLRDEYFRIITTPEKEAENDKEMKSILEIASLICKRGLQKSFTKNPSIKKLLNDHVEKFGWMGTDRMQRAPWQSYQEITERVELLVKENPQQQLSNMLKVKKEIKTRTKKIAKECRIKQDFVKVTKEYTFYRNFRMGVYLKSSGSIYKFWKEIGRRLKLDFENLVLLSAAEIIDLLKNEIELPKDILARRKNKIVLLKDNRINVLTGKKFQDFKKKNIREETSLDEKIETIKGTVANQGQTKGIVKVVLNLKDMKKVNKGDILVATMTIPEFVPAMEKAAAFVTDEGGILCHAAIVSREMNKPCIIGTKIATQVLKNGNKVEVDANKGIVKITK